MKRFASCLVPVALLLVIVPAASARKWTDSTGKFSVEADLIEVKDGSVRLKKPDATVLHFNRFSLCTRRATLTGKLPHY